MAAIVTSVAIAAFILAFRRARVVEVARGAIATTRGAVATMRDPALDELARERAVQSAGIRLLGASASLLLRSAAALVAAFVPILLADWAGLIPRDEAMGFMLRWDVIAVATIVVTLGWIAGARLWSR